MRSGTWKTNLSGNAAYKSFNPSPLPPVPGLTLDEKFLELLVEAHKKLSLLDGYAARIPNINLFISMYVRKEALMSSQIEGTQATLEDIFDPMRDENSNRDVAEVINYIKATEFAIVRLNDLPLCNRLIREAHAVLMENVRGQEKTPGEFRYSQNWIGGQGSTLKTARYIPPNPDDMAIAISELDRYMNEDEKYGNLDVLIRAALIHYQFETIHPFLDGNGRIGRLLVTLFLMEKKALSAPLLYISYALKKNRTEYYDRLMLVREKGNYEQWVEFFLLAVKETSDDALDTIDKLIALHDKNILVVNLLGRSAKNAVKVFNYLEENPIIEIKKTSTALKLSFNTVSGIINRLLEAGVLRQKTNTRRNRIFVYEEYLEILRNGTLVL
jgi:Fic family protein